MDTEKQLVHISDGISTPSDQVWISSLPSVPGPVWQLSCLTVNNPGPWYILDRTIVLIRVNTIHCGNLSTIWPWGLKILFWLYIPFFHLLVVTSALSKCMPGYFRCWLLSIDTFLSVMLGMLSCVFLVFKDHQRTFAFFFLFVTSSWHYVVILLICSWTFVGDDLPVVAVCVSSTTISSTKVSYLQLDGCCSLSKPTV